MITGGSPGVNGAGTTEDRLPPHAVVEVDPSYRQAVNQAIERAGVNLSASQTAVRKAGGKVYWVFSLPQPDADEDEWEELFDHAHVEYTTAADAPKSPLTARQWGKLRLAFDGIADDTLTNVELTRLAGYKSGSWLWDGIIPYCGVTTLAAQSKDGKSTLLRGLFRAGMAGVECPEFLGRPTAPFDMLVVSEEPEENWAGLPDGVRVRPFHGNPVRPISAWERYVQDLDDLACRIDCRVVVIDTFSRVCGADENAAKELTRALAPLRRMANHKAVVVLHHTTKTGKGIASIRGSSALAAQSDSILLLDRVSDDLVDPRRTLAWVGRTGQPGKLEYTRTPDGELVLSTPPASAKPAGKASAKAGPTRRDNGTPAPPLPSFFTPGG